MYTDCFKLFTACVKKVSKKKTLAILNNVCFNLDYASYTDLDVAVRLKLDIAIPNGEGFLVANDQLSMALKDLKKSKVVMLSKDGLTDYPSMQLSRWLVADSSKFPVADFPASPDISDVEFVGTIDSMHLSKGDSCTADDETRYALSGIYLDHVLQNIVSTDGRCILIQEWHGLSQSCIVPRKLIKVLSAYKGNVSLYQNKNFIRADIDGGSIQVICRKVDSDYPPYNQILDAFKPTMSNKISLWNRGDKTHYFGRGSTLSEETGATMNSWFDGDFEIAMSGIMIEQAIKSVGSGENGKLIVQHNGDGEKMMGLVNEFNDKFIFMPLRKRVKPQVQGV